MKHVMSYRNSVALFISFRSSMNCSVDATYYACSSRPSLVHVHVVGSSMNWFCKSRLRTHHTLPFRIDTVAALMVELSALLHGAGRRLSSLSVITWPLCNLWYVVLELTLGAQLWVRY